MTPIWRLLAYVNAVCDQQAHLGRGAIDTPRAPGAVVGACTYIGPAHAGRYRDPQVCGEPATTLGSSPQSRRAGAGATSTSGSSTTLIVLTGPRRPPRRS